MTKVTGAATPALGGAPLKGGPAPIRLLTLGWAIRWFGLSAYAPFVLIYLHSTLEIPYPLAGLLVAAPNVTGLVFPLLGGGLADRFGRHRMIVVSFALESAGLAMMGLGASLSQLLVVLAGLVCSRSFGTLGAPAVSAYVTDVSQRERRAEAQAWMRTGLNIGFTLGTLVGASVLSIVSFADLAYLTAVITVSGTIFTWLLVPTTQYDQRLASVPLSGGSDSKGTSTAAPRPSLAGSLRVMRQNVTLLLLWAAACSTWTLNQQIAYGVPTFARSGLGASYFLVGAVLAVNAVIVVALQVPLTRYLAGRSMALAGVAGTLAYAGGFVGMGLEAVWRLDLSVTLTALVAILTVGECLVFYPTSTLSMNLAPEEQRGAYAGAMNMSAGVGTVLAPLLAGLAFGAIGNPLVAWGFLAIPGVPAIALLLAVRRRVPPNLDAA